MSKKLEGNGLWESSRMILPQHKEQSMRPWNDRTSPKPEPPTNKEIDMIRDCIILPVALRIVEKKVAEVNMSSQTLKLLYAAAAKMLAKMIREEVQQSKKALAERNIRVMEDSRDLDELIYRYSCRGYEDRLVMTKDFMRDEISVRIEKQVRRLTALIQAAAKK